MARQYYSTRKTPQSLTLDQLYWKLRNLYLWFRENGYFTEVGITDRDIAESIKYEAAIALTFQLFPLTKWPENGVDITEDHIFDALEFLYDHVSKPGDWDDLGRHYLSFDKKAGRAEFKAKANAFLSEYAPGYELIEDGRVLALGSRGLQHILDAEIVPYDEVNVDSKVREAISKWRNRHLSLNEKREAIRELADVFEWLKKRLTAVLDNKDEAALFEIANNFAIRHHNAKQKSNYDPAIWYSWMFHFYLASYHAAIRLLIKHEKKKTSKQASTSIQ